MGRLPVPTRKGAESGKQPVGQIGMLAELGPQEVKVAVIRLETRQQKFAINPATDSWQTGISHRKMFHRAD